MKSDATSSTQSSYATRILSRFAHLLSAQGAEGILGALFYLYLAWLDSVFYGEVMYAIAVGSVVLKVVQFGLYYPLVSELGKASKEQTPEIINRVNIIKTGLFVASILFVLGMTYFRGLSFRVTSLVLSQALGMGFDALAETFLADLRVRGLQKIEARAKIFSVVFSYGFGFVTAAAGLHPVIVGTYRLFWGLILLVFGAGWYLKTYASRILLKPQWWTVWSVLRDGTVFALINILGLVYNKANIFFLESAAGVEGVARYSATYNLVDPVSVLGSEQLLGWVIFPVLSGLWWTNRNEVGPVVRRTAQWLLIIAFPIMHFLYMQSDFLIGSIYPAAYKDAAWMQRYLVWTIVLSFESNLFSYVMMVAGAAKVLLVFAVVTAVLNVFFNLLLVDSYGLAGACLVLVLTKLTMAVLSFAYVQLRFGFIKAVDLAFPLALSLGSTLVFWAVEPLVGHYAAGVLTFVLYSIVVWKVGLRILGHFPKKKADAEEYVPPLKE